MKYSKKQYNYYSDDERMSYIREYLSSPESKSEFCKRHGFCAKLLTYWLNKYQIFMFRKFNLPVLICKYRIYGPAPQIC